MAFRHRKVKRARVRRSRVSRHRPRARARASKVVKQGRRGRVGRRGRRGVVFKTDHGDSMLISRREYNYCSFVAKLWIENHIVHSRKHQRYSLEDYISRKDRMIALFLAHKIYQKEQLRANHDKLVHAMHDTNTSKKHWALGHGHPLEDVKGLEADFQKAGGAMSSMFALM